MSKSRFYGKDENGENILLGWYDFDTDEMTYCVSEKVVAEKRRKNTERISAAASDIAMRNPTSPLFDFAQ